MVRLSPWRLAGGRVRPTVCEAVVLSTHSPSSGRNRVIAATNHAARTPGGRIPIGATQEISLNSFQEIRIDKKISHKAQDHTVQTKSVLPNIRARVNLLHLYS